MMIRLMIITILGMLLGACANTGLNQNYEIKAEKENTLSVIPAWYLNQIKQKEVCNLNSVESKGTDKQCLFGTGTAVSPDLNLAIEKAKMLAKADIADVIKGEMNKQSKQFITELGKTEQKTIVSQVESTLVNVIQNTPVRGYEVFATEVTTTNQGYYRAWVGLKLPLGEYNKMYHYNIEEVANSYKLKEKADQAFKETVKNIENKAN
jgi:hypothetical protein